MQHKWPRDQFKNTCLKSSIFKIHLKAETDEATQISWQHVPVLGSSYGESPLSGSHWASKSGKIRQKPFQTSKFEQGFVE